MRRNSRLGGPTAAAGAGALRFCGLACGSDAEPAGPSLAPAHAATAELPQSGPVSSLSSADVWAATDEGVLRWNGRTWTQSWLPASFQPPGGH